MASALGLKARQTIQLHKLIEPVERVLVAVSGGPDSTALLRFLHGEGFRLAVAHFNHRWRAGDSSEDQAFVTELARSLGLDLIVGTATIPDPVRSEIRAREERLKFLNEVAQLGFGRVALGHTRDDRIETFFLNLSRGSGLDGLTAMRVSNGRTIRPFIDCSRDDVTAYLDDLGQPSRADASNQDMVFERNRLRHGPLKGLREALGARFEATMSSTLGILDAENAFMAGTADKWIAAKGRDSRTGFGIPIPEFSETDPAIQRRIVRRILARCGTLENVSFAHVESVIRLSSQQSGKRVRLPRGMEVERSFDSLVFRREAVSAPVVDRELSIPGQVRLPELGVMISARIVDKTDGIKGFFADGDRLGACVKIRTWNSGDYYKPVGMPSSKVKKLFQRFRVPRDVRQRTPMIVSGSAVVWVTPFPISRDFAPTHRSTKIVAFLAEPV